MNPGLKLEDMLLEVGIGIPTQRLSYCKNAPISLLTFNKKVLTLT